MRRYDHFAHRDPNALQAYKRYLIRRVAESYWIEKDGFTISRSEPSVEAAKATIDMLTAA